MGAEVSASEQIDLEFSVPGRLALRHGLFGIISLIILVVLVNLVILTFVGSTSAGETPDVASLDISPQEVYRGDDLTLFTDGTDDLTPESELELEMQLVQADSAFPMWEEQQLDRSVDVDISPDGRWIAVGRERSGALNGVYIYQRNGSIPAEHYGTPYSVDKVAFSPDSRYIVVATENDLVYLFEMGDMEAVRIFNKGSHDWITQLAVSAGNEYVVAATDQELFLFQIAGEDPDPIWSYDLTLVSDIAIAADGSAIGVASILGPRVMIYVPEDLKTEDFNLAQVIPLFGAGYIESIAISSGGERTVVRTLAQQVHLVESDTAEINWSRDISNVREVVISGDGRYVTVTSYGGFDNDTLLMLDGDTGEQLWSHQVGGRLSNSPVAISSTGSSIVVIFKNAQDLIHRIQLLYNWHTAEFSQAVFDGTSWQSTFRLPLDAPLGPYDFRVRFNDSEEWGSWEYTESSIRLLNAPPTVELTVPSQVNQGMLLLAQAHDLDGTIARYRWRSSVDGDLSGQSELDTSNLSVGNQTLYLAVQDNERSWSPEISASFDINGRPMAWLLDVPTAPILKGNLILLKGNGSDDDPDGSIVAHKWRIGTLVHHTLPGRTLELDSRLLTPGNHTLSFRVQDGQGAWSLPVLAWFWVSTPPKAIIMDLDMALLQGRTVLTLWGEGVDEGYIKKFQWRSTIDGIYEGLPGLMVVDNLSVGTHMLSFRVQDDAGQWSAWTHHPEPLTVAGTAADREPGAIAVLKEPRLYLLLLVTYLLSAGTWVTMRPYRNRWLAGQVQVHSERLWNLQDRFIALGLELDFPRRRMDRALEPLTRGHYWRAQERLRKLEREVEATFELFGECHSLRRKLKEATRYHSRQIRTSCPPRRLERLEYLWMVRRLKEYKEQAGKALEDLESALAVNGHRRGLPPSTMHWRPHRPGSGSLNGNGHGLTFLGPKPGTRNARSGNDRSQNKRRGRH